MGHQVREGTAAYFAGVYLGAGCESGGGNENHYARLLSVWMDTGGKKYFK